MRDQPETVGVDEILRPEASGLRMTPQTTVIPLSSAACLAIRWALRYSSGFIAPEALPCALVPAST